MAKVNPIPAGYHTVTPYIIVNGAAKALDCYKKAFNAIEKFRMEENGKIMHAEMQIGDSPIMIADENAECNAVAPHADSRSPVLLHLYVEDVDTLFKQAVAAGAKVERELADQFYGDRSGGVIDPFGHVWYIATHTEDLSEEEINKRYEAMKKPA